MVLPLLQRINLFLLTLAGWGIVMAMATIAVVIPCGVFTRYFLKSMPVWSEELATFAMVWVSMLGAAVGLKKGYQVGINVILENVPRPVGRILRGIGFLAMLLFLGAMLFYGVLQTAVNVRQISPAMEIPMALPYMALPAGFLLMLLITLEEILKYVGKATAKGE